MFFTITFLQWLCNEILVVIIPTFHYRDTIDTIFETTYIMQLCFGGIIWFAISKMLNKKTSKKNSFFIPLILMSICIITNIIHIVFAYINTDYLENIPLGIKGVTSKILLPLFQLIIYLLCYGIQWIKIKLGKNQSSEKKKKKKVLTFSYIIQWLFGNTVVFFYLTNYFDNLITQEGLGLGFASFIDSLILGTYILEITIGGLIWYLIYRYATKHNILTKLKAFFVPIVFMAISVITGFLLPPVGTYFQYLGNVLQVFCQICQFVVYLLSFLVADIILILKYNIAKRKQKRETN